MKSTILTTIITLSVGLQLTAAETNTVSRETDNLAGSKTNLFERMSSGIPVYKVVITNPPNPIPVTNAAVSWSLDPNATPVALENIPGYRPAARAYEPPQQDPLAATFTATAPAPANGQSYTYGPQAPQYPVGTYFTYGQSQNYPAGVNFSYGTGQYPYGGGYGSGYGYPFNAPRVIVGFGVGIRDSHHGHRHHHGRCR